MDNLDESKIEDDDMVEIVFQLTTNFAETQTLTQSREIAHSPPVTNVYPTRIGNAVGQKRQHSDEKEQSSEVQTNSTTDTSHNITSTRVSHQIVSSTKSVTVVESENHVVQISDGRSVRPRKKKTRSKSDLGLFKMFKNQGSQITTEIRSSGDGAEKPEAPVTESDSKNETVNPKRCFVHYDSRSILVEFTQTMSSNANNFQNLKSGAATASLSECEETEPGSLLLKTPNFTSECFDESSIMLNPSGSTLKNCPKHKVVVFEGVGSSAIRLQNGNNRERLLAGISLADHTVDRRFLSFEHMDHGANYYRRYFADYDHVNYFGNAEPYGPVAISMIREKADISSDRSEPTHQYRIIIRTAQLPTLRGSILEDFLPNTRGTTKIHFRDILECLAPEIKQDNLKLGENKVAVIEELIKLDELPLNTKYKIGLVYCDVGQKTEEDMYNNNNPSAAFEEFMLSVGEKVTLKGFDAFRAGLDVKNDTTGTHSLYTRYNHCQIMFHVSTLLPYTEKDSQQVVRKRHIGNDIVTVIFQEPGSEPFSPAHFRSHFQHVFVVVKVQDPCTPECAYQIAVTRSHEVPEFGPPIPEKAMKKGAAFRHFLLTKLINAENASYKAKKLALMQSRTREQLLNSFGESQCTTTSLQPNKRANAATKLGRSWSLRRKTRYTQSLVPELVSKGALKWGVTLVEEACEKPCILAISPSQLVVTERKTQVTMYMLPCKAILGWTSLSDTLKLYYDTGEVIMMRADTSDTGSENNTDIDDVVKRLTCVSEGCETQEITVIKNQAGKLGFHIQFQGIVGDVKENGPAWAAGLRPSSRLLEVRNQIVAHMEHDQLISALKGRDSIVVVALPPFPDGQARRSVSQLHSPTSRRTTNVGVRPEDKKTADSSESQENSDTIAPLIIRQNSRPASRESQRPMTRGSMIALNLLEKDLGIDQQHMDIDQLLESIVGTDNIQELENEVKELEARSSTSSRPQTPSSQLWASQQSLNEELRQLDEDLVQPTGVRGNPVGADAAETDTRKRRTDADRRRTNPDKRRKDKPANNLHVDNSAAKRYALGSDNLPFSDKIRNTSTGKRYALGSGPPDTLNYGVRSVVGAEVNDENNRVHEKPDLCEIFKMIDKTREGAEANNRSPTEDISDIDAVVSMIERVLENTDTVLEDIQTRGQTSDSETETAPPTEDRQPSSSPYSSIPRPNTPKHSNTPTPSTPNTSRFTRYGTTASSNKVDNIQRKMEHYNEDMSRAIEQLDMIHIRRSGSSSAVSSCSEDGGGRRAPTETSDSVNVNTENSDTDATTSDDDYTHTRHYTMRMMRREGLLMEPSDNSDHSRTSDNSDHIPPSPLQMLMERAREAQLDQSSDCENTWVRTTLLRIAELEAALERSNFELQILRKQNREMEQTLEIVDEENAKIRREMDRTSTQLSTFTQWVQNRQLL